jgi:hypothetical protein
MHRRWLLSVGACALTVLSIRGLSTRPAKAAAITHVAEYAGAQLGDDVSQAQYRYLRSQPHHWRQLMIKN